MKFARAVADLFQDAHLVAIVHGRHGESVGVTLPESGNAHPHMFPAAEIAKVETENRTLVAELGRARVPALGLCTGDAAMCEIRRCHPASPCGVEVASMNSRWIQTICANGGVPVISNVAFAPWGEHCLLDSDRLAADCAKAWRADALIYLTSVDGVRDADGSTIRWLDISHFDVLRAKSEITHDMLSKLTACRTAIESGIGRVRILPLSHVDVLPFFFSSRIDVGTEVVWLGGYSESAGTQVARTAKAD